MPQPKIKFISERTLMATKGLYRTGWTQFEYKGYTIDISKMSYKGKITYKIIISNENSYDSGNGYSLPEIKNIIKNINNYALINKSII